MLTVGELPGRSTARVFFGLIVTSLVLALLFILRRCQLVPSTADDVPALVVAFLAVASSVSDSLFPSASPYGVPLLVTGAHATQLLVSLVFVIATVFQGKASGVMQWTDGMQVASFVPLLAILWAIQRRYTRLWRTFASMRGGSIGRLNNMH